MINDINLFKKSNQKLFKQKRSLIIIRYSAIFFLLIVIVTAISVFLLNHNPQYSALKQQEKDLLSQLSLQQDKIVKLEIIHNRVNDIQTIISSRDHLDKTIDSVASLLPSNIQLTSLTISKKNLVFTVSAVSLLDLNNFLENIANKVYAKDLLKNVTIGDFNGYSKNQIYTISITGELL